MVLCYFLHRMPYSTSDDYLARPHSTSDCQDRPHSTSDFYPLNEQQKLHYELFLRDLSGSTQNILLLGVSRSETED